jgi:hypothetical protein
MEDTDQRFVSRKKPGHALGIATLAQLAGQACLGLDDIAQRFRERSHKGGRNVAEK